MATNAKDPTSPASTGAGVSGGDSKVETPSVPPSPTPQEPKAISPAEALMELEHRGFTSGQELVDMIRRYDNVIKESKLAQEQILIKQQELEVAMARMDEREESLRVKAQKVMEQRKAADERLETVNARIAILTKLSA